MTPVTDDDAHPRLGPLIRDLRVRAGLSQQELARRIGTTQSGISRLEAGTGNGTGNRLDTLARVATALGRHLVVSFPAELAEPAEDTVVVA